MSVTVEDYLWISRYWAPPHERVEFFEQQCPGIVVNDHHRFVLFNTPYPRMYREDLARFLIQKRSTGKVDFGSPYSSHKEAWDAAEIGDTVIHAPISELPGPDPDSVEEVYSLTKDDKYWVVPNPWTLFWRETKTGGTMDSTAAGDVDGAPAAANDVVGKEFSDKAVMTENEAEPSNTEEVITTEAITTEATLTTTEAEPAATHVLETMNMVSDDDDTDEDVKVAAEAAAESLAEAVAEVGVVETTVEAAAEAVAEAVAEVAVVETTVEAAAEVATIA